MDDAMEPQVIHPTAGFTAYQKKVSLVGGLTTDANLVIYDVAGGSRYEQLRALIAQQCHGVALCYCVHSKLSMVEAANTMVALEEALGPQTVVVCGFVIDPHRKREVTESDAEGISVRCRVSLQTANPVDLFEALVQSMLDRLVMGTALVSPTSAASPSTHHHKTVAQALLNLSATPSILDVLLDIK